MKQLTYFLGDVYENISVSDFNSYHPKDMVRTDSRLGYSDVKDVLHSCIQYYKTIPSNICSSQTK